MSYPPYNEDRDEFLTREIAEWAIGNGLVMLNGDASAIHAPVTMYPSRFPRHAFQEAISIQKAYNLLYISVCQERSWLETQLNDLAKLDTDFTGKLVEIYLKLKNDPNGFPQKLTGGLFRSDYLLDKNQNQIKQVEFNTVSVSFGGLSPKVGSLHDYLFKTDAYNGPLETVEISKSAEKMGQGLEKMHSAYNRKNSAVLFVVQPGERNVADQRAYQYELAKHGIPAYRTTLAEVIHVLEKNSDNSLIYKPTGKEISVVYYRAGYAPSDYSTQTDWDARYFLEKSTAIKCPSVFTQLSGSKKIQQLLTSRKVIEKLAPSLSKQDVDGLLKTFVAIHSLDHPDPKLKHMIEHEAAKYVLKPQREGGGNNIYKQDITDFLSKLPEDKWGAHILMELIEPPARKNKIFRAGNVWNGGVISELGIFGASLWDDQTVYFNDECDHLLRTKFEESNEGGVAAGFGCIDSIILE